VPVSWQIGHIRQKTDLEKNINIVNKQISQFQNTQSALLSGNAQLIKTSLAGVNSHYTAYNKGDLEKKINGGFTSLGLVESDLIQLNQDLNCAVRDELSEINTSFAETGIQNLVTSINDILGKNIVNNTIQKLKNNQELSSWIRKGIDIHTNTNQCEFCGSTIQKERLDTLGNHFNDEYIHAINKIDELKSTLISYSNISDKININSSLLYKEFETEFTTIEKQIKEEIALFKEWINKLTEIVEEKKNKLNESYSLNINTYDLSKLNGLYNKLNSIIQSHNKKTQELNSGKVGIAEKIENYHISTILKDYENNNSSKAKLESELLLKNGNFSKIRKEIEELNKQIKTHAGAIDEVNGIISSLLGRDEISLKLEEEGYSLIRDNFPFTPSEGEKTVIALAYFISKLKEDGFNISDSIVVIDDPISSLDENILFNIYNLLSSILPDAKQIFILTHHFSFFKLFSDSLSKSSKDNISYYRIKNLLSDSKRNAIIVELEKELLKYHSEYEFLFKTIYKYWNENMAIQDKTINISEGYNYANMTRKLIEGFLSFKYPQYGSNLKEKLKQGLTKSNMLGDESTIYQFLNIFSHNNSLKSFTEIDMTTFTNAWCIIDKVMTMIQKNDGDHFQNMINI
ncbi:MAG TPA: AAA family ATPase, partial [Candidatus Absconditabacterales bacterium]|nr:AAA family ATPase [Candidatus Absconditabacterales bacterium]